MPLRVKCPWCGRLAPAVPTKEGYEIQEHSFGNLKFKMPLCHGGGRKLDKEYRVPVKRSGR